MKTIDLEALQKDAIDLQAAFVQIRDLKQECKDLKKDLSETDEHSALADVKKRMKALQEAHAEFMALNDEKKKAAAKRRDTKQFQQLAAARQMLKEARESVSNIAQSVVREVSGTRPPDEV